MLRAISFLFHLGLGLFLMLLALVTLLGPEATFTVGILPWQGRTLAWILLAAGAAAILAVFLAVRRMLTLPLLLWSLIVLAVLVYGYFLSRYSFGRDGPAVALQLLCAAALAAAGSWRLHSGKGGREAAVGRFERNAG